MELSQNLALVVRSYYENRVLVDIQLEHHESVGNAPSIGDQSCAGSQKHEARNLRAEVQVRPLCTTIWHRFIRTPEAGNGRKLLHPGLDAAT